MASPSSLIAAFGPDGMAIDPPVLAFTEKALEAKELEIKKYIEENYSKIRNVERELASLAFEKKLTAGPKKAALEHLRKKIELSGERIKVARQKEEQAKKVWEAAAKVLKEEEDKKQMLCDDLNRLVQETAAIQYSRLEDLKKKLEALDGHHVVASVPLPKEEAESQHGPPNEESKPATTKAADAIRAKPVTEKEIQKVAPRSSVPDEEKLNNLQQSSPLETRNRNTLNRPSINSRGRGNIVKGYSGQKSKGNSWTGAGFDVDDNAINN